jgi:2-hydroxychromene-2-carboxylate isomerase
MADVEFFWDPVCPWAWITSRWVVEVAGQRALDVRWRPIALRFVNDRKDYETEMPPQYQQVHGTGLSLLRVATAVEAAHGNAAAGELYTQLGAVLHLAGTEREQLYGRGAASIAEEALGEAGLPTELAAAADDASHDAAIRESTDTALSRAGKDVGTPILTFGPPDGPSFFGPVISRVPRGAEAVELWDAVETMARHSWFAELKRSLRERPQVAS